MLAASPMQDFRILSHPADIGFEAFGATRQEAFVNAARALTSLRTDLTSIVPRASVDLTVQGSDWAGLLVNWLSEILYLEDAEDWLFCSYDVRLLRPTQLLGTASGEKFNPSRHPMKTQVKAVTYHQLSIEQEGSFWRAQVFVDV